MAKSQDDTVRTKKTLSHRVPRALLAEMQTDRPDATESAYSLAAGHIQVEADLFKQVRARDQKLMNVESSFNVVNLKLGLSKRTDIQVVIPSYIRSITKDRPTGKVTEKNQGFGDITIRYKYNAWGNDGGKTALALLPFLSFPTASSGSAGIGAGVVIPFALEISDQWSFGAQVGFATAKEDDNLYHSAYLSSFTFGRSLSKKLDMFTEVLVNYNVYQSQFDSYVNGGLIWGLSDNLNLDAGIYYGVKALSGRAFFTGFSLRL
jgi:hypothetical protein